MVTVGELFVETFAAHGIDRIFCVPGESYLGLLDALHDRKDVDTVVCRHESGAGFMALTDARLTGRPGIACVSRGPGASNAAIAVHTAQQDAVPFILIIGQVATQDVRRDSFQEIDYGKMFGSIAKWTAEITDPELADEVLLRALQTATTGLPGPVVISVPENILTSQCSKKAVKPQAPISAAPSQASIEEFRKILTEAERPLVIAGSEISKPGEREKLLRFVESWELPTVVSFRRQDLLPNGHRLYMGDMGLSNPASQMRVLAEADVIVVLGSRLTDITTQGYTFPQLVRPKQKVVHVHSDITVIGTHFASDLSIGCHAISLIDAIGTPQNSLPDRENWIGQLKSERYKISAVRQFDVNDGVPFELVVDFIGRHMDDDAILTLDAGTFAAPAYRVIEFRPPQRLLAPISGAMGFGIPAAVAASLRAPERQVICFVGDGGLLMTGSELAVALERELPLKVIVSENQVYGSILVHQERDYPGRYVGTKFVNPDLELSGRAYNCTVTRISELSQISTIAGALRAPGPQMIIVDSSVKAILPRSHAPIRNTE